MLSNLALTILRTQTSEEKVRELTPGIIFFINMHLFVRIHVDYCGDDIAHATSFTRASAPA